MYIIVVVVVLFYMISTIKQGGMLQIALRGK